MNKSELVDSIAQQAGLTKDQATKALNAFTASVQGALERGDDVVLVGFGTFSVKERAARTGRNPKTGEELQIAASKVPSFKAGKGLKDAVNPVSAPKKGKK
ncbi:HU family DNA-binding protein [Moraxella oblonga]|uniref:HU family DNA-binding protein n=1 Tax=Moraxella oblonga TaxID=200413 RepID=UPI000829CDCC|nr:HU family DNA-binding protein [Moraxella oblonga]